MKNKIKYFFLMTIIISNLFLWAKKHKDPSLARTLVNIKVTSSYQNPIMPWQSTRPEIISGQAVAVAPYQLLCLASLVKNSILIQVEPYFQAEKIEAFVKTVDYDSNLCLLEVPKNKLKKAFKPVKLKTKIQIGDNVQLIWLSKSRRFIKTNAKIEHPDSIIFPRKQIGFLYFQLSSNSSPEGYSEPVFSDSKLIGLIESFNQENKSSSMLPAQLINVFLQKTKNDKYIPSPKFGFAANKLTDKSTREYSKLPEAEKRGIFIKEVFDYGTGSKELKKGDILVKLGNYDIDTVGNITHPEYGKLFLFFLLSQYKTNDTIEAEIYRNGTLLKINLLLQTFTRNQPTVPYIQYDNKPNYIIHAGYVFTELNYNYLKSFGDNWSANIDPLLLETAKSYSLKKHSGKNRIVILSSILKHPINQGYHNLRNKIVESINGKDIKDLQDIQTAFSTSADNGFYTISFKGFNIDAIIPEKEIKKANEEIKSIYSINSLSHIN